jgi:hypothetical protein
MDRVAPFTDCVSWCVDAIVVICSEMARSCAVSPVNFSWCFRMRTKSFAIIVSDFVWFSFAAFFKSAFVRKV